MHLKMFLGLVAIATLSSAGMQDDQAATDAKALARAGKLFKQSCLMCHSVPDTRFETDRAWLSQVYDTA